MVDGLIELLLSRSRVSGSSGTFPLSISLLLIERPFAGILVRVCKECVL